MNQEKIPLFNKRDLQKYNCFIGETPFVFKPSHPYYTQKIELKTQKLTEKKEKTIHRTQMKQTKTTKNRLFSLPTELIEKIFEYDDTNKKYFEEKILCKTEEINETDKEKNRFKFYQMIINNRGFRFGNRKKYCQLISCISKSSWFNDGEDCEFPFPHELENLNSRYISSVKVQKNIYKYNGKKYHFIRCEMEIREFVKGLYDFLGEPEEEDFEVFLYRDWEDEYEKLSFRPINGGLPDYFNERVSYGQYKKIMLMGEAINDFCNLTLFADKNENGKDILYIQVDMDIEQIEDDVQDMTGFVIRRMVERKICEIYNMRVYEVIQVNKKHLATNLFAPV